MANLQDAMLQELRSGIHVLQSQDNHTVSEATDLVNGMRQELAALRKRISDNTLQILAAKGSTQAVQKVVSVLSKWIDEVNKAMVEITTSLKNVPSKRELHLHVHTMEEALLQIAKMNMGLTTAMEGYKLSESTPFGFRRSSVTVGPTGTQYVHPQRQAAFNQQSPSVSSLRDTASEYSWHARMRGGVGSIAGGADGGAAGGGAAGDLPPPPDPPPSDHGGARTRRISRRQRRIKELEFAKPSKIKEQKKFYENTGDDFDTWWV